MGAKDLLSAQAILFSTGGKSIAAVQAVTTRNIQGLVPAPGHIEKAAAIMRAAGFICRLSSPTLSVSGTQSLFEDYFSMKLSVKNHQGAFYAVVEQKAVVPASLKSLVQDIVFGEPMSTFQ